MRTWPDNPWRRWPGFTLLELLVVIAVIGLLLAILMPSLAHSRLLAKRTVCQVNLAAIGKAAAMYQVDNLDYVPICWANIGPDKVHPWKSWRTNLLPYASGFAAFNCPAVTDRGVKGELFHSAEEVAGQQMQGTINAGSYGVIYQYSLPGYETPSYAGVQAQGHPMWSCAFSTAPGAAWRNPSGSVYVADALLTDGPISYPSGPGYRGYGTSVIVPPSETDYSSGDLTRRFSDRHVGTACLFVDGHGVTYETKKLDAMVAGRSGCVWSTE